jgi:hypothetical protein
MHVMVCWVEWGASRLVGGADFSVVELAGAVVAGSRSRAGACQKIQTTQSGSSHARHLGGRQ